MSELLQEFGKLTPQAQNNVCGMFAVAVIFGTLLIILAGAAFFKYLERDQ